MWKRLRINYGALLLSSLLTTSGLVGCQTTSKIVPPPLPDPPTLESTVLMENPKTKELGFWISWPDMQAEAVFRETVKTVKEVWK